MRKLFLMALLFFVFPSDFFAQSEIHAVRLSSTGKVSHTIIYQNHQVVPVLKQATVSYSAADSLLSGVGNIRLLATPFSGSDYRINSSSAAYNQGNRSLLKSSDSLDLDYRPRVSCEQVDLGAYEFQVVTTKLTKKPQPQHVCEGTPMLLTAQAEGTHLSYQWQRNGQNLVGKVSSLLALSGALTDTGSYRVIALGDCCNDTSDWVRVVIDAQPSLVAMNDTTVLSESDVALRVLSAVGRVHWLEADNTTLVLDTMIRNIRQTVEYIAVATNGLCPMEVRDRVMITVDGTPCRISAKADTTLCLGATYLLNILSTTVDYKWYILGTTTELGKFSVVRPTDTLRLAVVGTNEHGTTCADTVTIAVRKVALKAMADKSVCSGAEVELTSVPAADDWFTLDGLHLGSGNYVKVFPPMNATTLYIVRRSDGVCVASDTVRVYANPPNLRASFVDTVVCEGGAIHLQTNIDPALLAWRRLSTGEDMGFDPHFVATQSEVYQGWAYDALCGNINVEVNVRVQAKPAFAVVEPEAVCENSSVFLSSVPNASYWRLMDGTRVSNPVVATLSQAYVGVYTEGVCTVMDTLLLAVETMPVFVACSDTTIRRGQSVDLWSTPAASYWQVRDSTSLLTSLRVSPHDTTYYIARFEAGVCGLLSDTVAVYVIGLDTFYLDLTYDYGCRAGEGWGLVRVLDDQQQNTTFRYRWSTGSQDSLIEGLGWGTFTVTVTNTRGVQVVASFTLTERPSLSVAIQTEEPNNENCDGGTILLSVTGGTPGYEYSWSHGSVSKDLLNVSSGVYQLTITDGKGCELVTEVRLGCLYRRVMPTLFITPNGDGKNDYLDIKHIEFYPNNRVVILNSYGEEIVKLRNYDNQSVIWDGRNAKGEKIPDGVYYYIIEAEGLGNMAGWILMKLSKSN